MRSFFINSIIFFLLLTSGCKKNFSNHLVGESPVSTEANQPTDKSLSDGFEIICPFPEVPFTNINKWRSYLSNCVTLDSAFVKNIPTGKYTVIIGFKVAMDGKAVNIEIMKDPGYGFGKKALEIFDSYKGQWRFNMDEEPFYDIYMRQPVIFEIE